MSTENMFHGLGFEKRMIVFRDLDAMLQIFRTAHGSSLPPSAKQTYPPTDTSRKRVTPQRLAILTRYGVICITEITVLGK